MPLKIVRGEISRMRVDAIVKATNSRLPQGSDVGVALLTDGDALSAKYVIYTAIPVWQGGTHHEPDLLAFCYTNSLNLALEHGLNSIAFPFISFDSTEFTQDEAMRVALTAIGSFLLRHEMTVHLVFLDTVGYALADRLAQSLVAYIEDNYVARRTARRRPSVDEPASHVLAMEQPMTGKYQLSLRSSPTSAPHNLHDLVNRKSESFTEMLLRLIDASGRTDPEVYKRANLDRKLFSKIRSNVQYRPSKNTALALAVALELNIDQTADLLRRAGYALSPSNRFDLIVKYFISEGNYNIFEINEALFAFDESMLGA